MISVTLMGRTIPITQDFSVQTCMLLADGGGLVVSSDQLDKPPGILW